MLIKVVKKITGTPLLEMLPCANKAGMIGATLNCSSALNPNMFLLVTDPEHFISSIESAFLDTTAILNAMVPHHVRDACDASW